MCATYFGDLRFSLPSSIAQLQTLRKTSVSGPANSRSETSPTKNRLGSLSDLRGSLADSRKSPLARKGSIWDSFFQYDIEYQGKASKK